MSGRIHCEMSEKWDSIMELIEEPTLDQEDRISFLIGTIEDCVSVLSEEVESGNDTAHEVPDAVNKIKQELDDILELV